MEASGDEGRPEARGLRRLGCWGWVVVVLGLVLLALGGLRLAAAQRLAAAKEKWRAVGAPLTPVELDAFYTAVPTTEQNAGLVILDVMDTVMASAAYGESAGPVAREVFWVDWDGGQALSAVELEELQKLVVPLEREMEQLRRAAEIENCRYPVDLSLGWESLLPHMAKVRPAVRLLRYDAMAAIAADDADRAVASIEAAFAIAKTLQREPILVSVMAGIRADLLTLKTLQGVVAGVALSTDHKQRLRAVLADRQATRPVALGYVGEAACTAHALDDYPELVSMIRPAPPLRMLPRGMMEVLFGVYSGIGILDIDKAFALERMHDYHRLAKAETYEERSAVRRESGLSTSVPTFLVGSQMIVPGLVDAPDRQLQWQAELRVAAQALAPEAGVLEDPFTGEGLREQVVTGRRYVYSLGANGVDDGLWREDDGGGGSSDDVYFWVPLADDKEETE